MPMSSLNPEYEFDGFKTGGVRARSVEAEEADDIFDYVPVLDYCLVALETSAEKKTAGGIVLPEQVQKDPVEGRVVAAGPGNHQNGAFIPNRIAVGEWVRFGQWASEPSRRIKVAGKVYLLMREEDIIMKRPSKSTAPVAGAAFQARPK